jgi:hypothetical protein
MADFSISGRMSVAGLQRQFSTAFGLELRVYKGPKAGDPKADPKATLASLSNKKVDDFECKGNTRVGNFETKFEKATGLKVQVATLPSADGRPGTLVSDDLTLSQAAQLGSEKATAPKKKVTDDKVKKAIQIKKVPKEEATSALIIEVNGKRIQVAQSDFPEMLNWEDAKKVCENLGHGWRLPTMKELTSMWGELHAQGKGNFSEANYWSSEESYPTTNHRILYFSKVESLIIGVGQGHAGRMFCVRAVRDL